MSLKLLLNTMITALLLFMLLVGSLLTLRSAQSDIRAELESTAGLALHLIDKELLYLADEKGIPHDKTPFSLDSLGHVRHLRIEYFDTDGRLRDTNQLAFNLPAVRPPPTWFIRLVALVSTEVPPKRRRIVSNDDYLGEVVITPDPSYEIAEIWHDSLEMLVLVASFFIAVNLLVYWAVDRALRPVSKILEAINEFERGNLSARLPQLRLPELSRISEKFNGMAETLQKSITRNHKLSQQLMRLQEDERKSLARELHDEIGQSLAAIHTDAAAIANCTQKCTPAHDSAQAIIDVSRQLMGMVRNMLEKLRPETLDNLGLKVALEELAAKWRQRHPGIVYELHIGDDLQVTEPLRIVAYRIVQESLTNISRHANASFVSISVWIESGILAIVVEDDGCGFIASSASGFGLVGMRERVEGMNGELEIHSALGKGSSIMARLPLKETR